MENRRVQINRTISRKTTYEITEHFVERSKSLDGYFIITHEVSVFMTIKIPVRKIDNRTTVIATNTRIFDVPIVREKEFDSDDLEGVIEHDDLEGVIDDRDNPDDQTIPIDVEILREIIVNYSKNNMK